MKLARYIGGIIYLSFFIVLASITTSCQNESENEGHLIYIERYDKLQAAYMSKMDNMTFQLMKRKYPQETAILYENVLSLGDNNAPEMKQALQKFYSDTLQQRVMQDVEKKFKDLSYIEDSLNMAFLWLKIQIPTLRIPTLYTQVSAFNQSIVVSDTIVGISLDKYLGEDYPLYAQYYYPYQRHTMTPGRIVPDVLFFYLCSEYIDKQPVATFAERLVNIGKIQWIVYKAAGYKNLGTAMGYTKEENEWMENNESKVWYYLINNRLLAKPTGTDHESFDGEYLKNYFHTNVPSYMPMWMGARLVGHFMRKNKGMTALELLNCDYKRIYETAGFSL